MSDLKRAVRQLLKNPGSTAVGVLTLALGIQSGSRRFQGSLEVQCRTQRPVNLREIGQAAKPLGDGLIGGHFEEVRDRVRDEGVWK